MLSSLVAAYYGLCSWWPDWMSLIGVGKFRIWFLDTRAVLAASDAHVLGIHPGAHNPLDLLRLPHTYSDWWFGLAYLHLTRADYLWVGAVLVLSFLACALLQVKARTIPELLWSLALLCSPPVVFGFNRGNADLLVFMVLAALVPCLVSRRAWVRWLSVGLIAFATGMKFYPAIALLVLLAPTRPRREIIMQLVVAAALVLAIGLNQAESIARYSSEPIPIGFFAFGADVTPKLFGASLWVAFLCSAAFGGLCTVYWWKKAPRWSAPAGLRDDYFQFLLGAVILVGCYFSTVNYLYRLVCAIFMVPFLWATWSSEEIDAGLRRLGRAASVLLLIMCWFDGIACLVINTTRALSAEEVNRWTDWVVLAEQPIIAALMATLLGFIVPFGRDGVRALFQPPQTDPGIPGQPDCSTASVAAARAGAR